LEQDMVKLLKIDLLKLKLNKELNKSVLFAKRLELKESQKEFGNVLDVRENLLQTHII